MGRSVVIVDDHVGFRRGAAELLGAAGFDVVACCPDGRSALDTIVALRPDIVLLDVQLPDIDGFAVIERLALAAPPAIVLVSSREAADYGGRVAASGAVGFITKADLSAASLADVVAGR